MGLLSSFIKLLPGSTKSKPKGLRSYNAAQIGRKTAGWMTSNVSQDIEVRAAFATLRNRARDLGRNNPNVRSYLQSLETNVVGKGIRLQSIIKDKNGNVNHALNSIIEDEFKIWCEAESCDVRGMMDFEEIERLIIRTIAESGEAPIVRFIYKKFGRSKINLSLQILEADHLDIEYNLKASEGQNQVRMGIEINDFGRPLAYWLFERHPGDTGNFTQTGFQRRIRVPADQIIFFFKHERAEQTRAVTWLASTMPVLRQLGEYLDASALRKKVESAIMFFIKRAVPDDLPASEATGALDTASENGQNIIDVEGGAVYNLDYGEDVVSPPISANPGADEPFIKTALRSTAAGLSTSYENISKDFSSTTYSSARVAMMSERDLYKIIQDWFSKKFHKRVFEEVIYMGVVSGVFDLPGYFEDKKKYDRPRWLPRGFDWVDPYNDMMATKEAIKAGLTTVSDVLAQQGKDLEETVNQLKKEKEMFAAAGLTPDVFFDPKSQINNQKNGDSTNANTKN